MSSQPECVLLDSGLTEVIFPPPDGAVAWSYAAHTAMPGAPA